MAYELYFKELTPDAQKEYLEQMGLRDPKEANLDIFPIAEIELPEPEYLTLKLYSSIAVSIPSYEDAQEPDAYMCDFEPEVVDGKEALVYEDVIRKALAEEMTPDMEEHGLMEYYHEFDSVSDRVKYAFPTVEEHNGALWCITECRVTEKLNQYEIGKLKDYITGQYSDGFGESFEQHDIPTADGPINIHLWQSNDDYCILTERELKESENRTRNTAEKGRRHNRNAR